MATRAEVDARFFQALEFCRQHGIPPGPVMPMYYRHNRDAVTVIERCVLSPTEAADRMVRKLKDRDLMQHHSFEAIVLEFPEFFSPRAQEIAAWRMREPV